MKLFIPIGTLITLVGIFILFRCVYKVDKARNSKLSDEELKTALQSVVPTNLLALFLSAIGLMTVIIGIVFS